MYSAPNEPGREDGPMIFDETRNVLQIARFDELKAVPKSSDHVPLKLQTVYREDNFPNGMGSVA